MKRTNKNIEAISKAIDIPTIRLSSDETRSILSCYRLGKLSIWRQGPLVELGLIVPVKVKKVDNRKAIQSLRARLKELAPMGRFRSIEQIVGKLRKLEVPEKSNRKNYQLTPLGKEVARGITVRIASQFGGLKG